MNINHTAQSAAVALLAGIRTQVAELVGDGYTSIRLEIDGTGEVQWKLYNSDAGKFATGPDLAACIAEQVRLNGLAARAQRKREEAARLIEEATALEKTAA